MSNSTQLKAPFRADIVGSFLRPQAVKDARAAYAAGALDAEGLKAVEDEAIRDLVAKQKAAGLQVITDGEFRRSYWHLDFMWGLNGIERRTSRTGYMFHDEETTADTAVVTGPISGENHPFVEHFKFVHALEDENTVAKQTIPAPAQFFQQMILPDNIERTRKVYATDEALIEAIAAGYRTVIRDLYAAGCRNLQFDDCTWGVLAAGGKKGGKFAYVEGSDLKKLAEQFVTVNNLAIEGSPDDLVINTHVCRGNYHSVYFASGAYDPIADPLFTRENVNAYYLEFDDERSGGFTCLKDVTPGKKVVLGLITTKRPELEDKAAIIARIHEAAKYVPLENLYLSPQCGFASCEIGNKLTEEQQWAKLALVKEIAKEVWG